MRHKRPSTTAPTLAAFATVAAPLAVYVAGYLWLGDSGDEAAGVICRSYSHQWQATIFEPAGYVEESIVPNRRRVRVLGPEDSSFLAVRVGDHHMKLLRFSLRWLGLLAALLVIAAILVKANEVVWLRTGSPILELVAQYLAGSLQ